MLAHHFLSAALLGFPEVEHAALIAVLGAMERGEIPDGDFTMARLQHDCGAPACICGWAHAISGGRAFPELAAMDGHAAIVALRQRLKPAARDLLWLDTVLAERRRPNVAQAAPVLRTFLTTGETHWPQRARAATPLTFTGYAERDHALAMLTSKETTP